MNGPALYTVYPHGSTDKLPYVTMGSGSLAAMSVFEDGFKMGMNVCCEKWCQTDRNRPNREMLIPDWLITSHVT